MKINAKLIIAFALALLITSVSVSYFSFSKAREIAVDGELKNMSEIINLIDINVTSKSRLIGNAIKTAANSGTIRYLFSNIEQSDITLTEEGFDYLNRLFQELGQINGVYLLWGDEVLMIQLDEPVDSPTGPSQRTVRLEKITKTADLARRTDRMLNQLTQANQSGTRFFGVDQSLSSRDPETPGVLFAGIRVDSPDQIPMAILCEVDVIEYYNILPISMGLLQNQTTFILDQQNNIISSNKSLDRVWVNEIVKTANLGSRKYTMTSDGTDYYIYKQYNGLTGWNSYSIIKARLIFVEQEILKNFIVNFALITTIFSGILFILMSTHFTKPLKDLIGAMKLARSGNYDIRVDDSRKDEIGDLNKAYNFLIDEINRLVHEVYEEKLAIKNAQINALQAQVNPHFLYNTLDSINWMLIDKGDFQSSRIIQSLGKMLRYSINTDESDVPLEAEIDFVENYLRIQKNRMEENLNFEIAIPPELLTLPVPKLFLQPIVENAIKHGLNSMGRAGTIKIWATGGETVQVMVEDDGIGMSPEKIQSLGELKSQTNLDSTHIGLVNVNQRIKLKYGEAYGILIDSQPGEGTKVTIRLPKKEGTIS